MTADRSGRWFRRRRQSSPPGSSTRDTAPEDGEAVSELRSRLAGVLLDGSGGALQRLIGVVAEQPERHRAALAALAGDSESADLQFKALYLLFYTARRNKDYAEQQRLAQQLAARFSDVPVVAVLVAEAAAAGQTAEGPLRAALRLAEEASRGCPQISGSHFVVAETALALFEAREYRQSAGQGDEQQRDLLQRAGRACERALRIRPEYPKYLAFRARVLALEERFEEAFASVTRAIDLESPQRSDYAIRISDYQLIKMEVRYRQHGSRIQAAQDSALAELSLARQQMLELLGLLAAVIAFLVTGTQIAVSAVEIDAGLRLLVVMAGCILLVFSTFSFVFGLRRLGRQAVGGFVGLALLLAPIMLGSAW